MSFLKLFYNVSNFVLKVFQCLLPVGTWESGLDKFSTEIQRLSTTDCNFQGFSRRWIFILKFEDFQDACQPYSTLPSTDTFVWRVRRSWYRHSQEMTNSELLLSWKTWDTDTGWRSGEIELDKLTQIDENFVTKKTFKKIQTERVPPKQIQSCSLLQGNIARRRNRPSENHRLNKISFFVVVLFFLSFFLRRNPTKGNL